MERIEEQYTQSQFTHIAEAKMSFFIDSHDVISADEMYTYIHGLSKRIAFGKFLKRYIYRKYDFPGKMDDTPDEDYAKFLAKRFKETGTPCSFKESSKTVLATCKCWIGQATIRREQLFLLAFALDMNAGEVSEFLTKCLCLNDYNFSDYREVIMFYCHYFHKTYETYRTYEDMYETLKKSLFASKSLAWKDCIQSPDFEKNGEKYLTGYLRGLKYGKKSESHATAVFKELYAECAEIIGSFYDGIEKITSGEVAREIYSAIKVDEKGNFPKITKTAVGDLFNGRLLTRQRISNILKNKVEAERSDILTLQFFNYSYRHIYDPANGERDRKQLAENFIIETNRLLIDCSFFGLYPADPMDEFMILCFYGNDDPHDMFSDTIEKMLYNEADWETGEI